MRFLFLLLSLSTVFAQSPCTAAPPFAELSIPHVSGHPALTLDSSAAPWKNAARAVIVKDCSQSLGYETISTDVRVFWTDTDLYLLFRCPFKDLNLFLPAANGEPRDKLWDRDVVEMFLGDDWKNIRHYREFEIAPTADWIDLAIDLDHQQYDKNWRSGWQTTASIDRTAHVWSAAARIPLSSVTSAPVKAGTRWRMNLYRIEGLGPDSQRRFLCWQPTCVQNRDPNHVPEHFGTLVFAQNK